ncbi:tumor necrosis factor a (TNF superfamily, member 2) [Electrophorus electricus]|uniref:Lymphotoxin-alpha n=1 Tax=Electrophorus electricus TaxID=8005 RepID=A0A4W4F1I9_ELEEL|nr:tumor necrosis factor a (TNF superfamily, member 2) [Electrophorus electricus]XP_035385185.1 tumor necrosis factor a (TNF superfamily, member 2) [Electrophorus electricus]
MASDKEVILEVQGAVLSPAQATVRREKHASRACSVSWNLCGVLFAVSLCFAASLCFALNTMHRNAEEAYDIRHTLREISGNAKTAIHLSGDYNSEVSNTSVEWRDNEDHSFAEGGLQLKDNQIHIPRNGLYFVYSQATYHVSCTTDPDHPSDHDVVHLSHEVSCWSGSYDSWKPLLSTVRSVCERAPAQSDDSGESWFTAVYLGAVFRLQAGDRLCTRMDTERLPEIEGENGKTFFGAFSL